MPKESLQTLTEPMYYVLLSVNKPLCGIEIMDAVKTLSHGRVEIGPGTLYTMLAKFEENKFIEPFEDPDQVSSKRKSYKITPAGRNRLIEEYERINRLAEDGKQIMEELNNENH